MDYLENLLSQDKQYVLNLYNRMDLHIVKGEGSYLYDSKGNKYLDMFSGIAVNNLGHQNPEIKDAIKKQMESYFHISNFFVSQSVVALAKLLVENSFSSKVFFSNSGTEANEAALKLARKYGKTINEDKVEILSFYNSFHGRTYGGMTLTGQEKYKQSFKPVIPGIKHISFNDIDNLKETVSDQTCAIFLEIIQGEGGIREISQQYIDELIQLSKKHKFLIVVDEIQTGLGRSGDLFAYEKLGLTPDIVTLAKSLGGGLPIGAMLVSKNLENVLVPGDHGSTFGGNPLACAAGEVILKTITKENFLKEVRAKSKYLIEKLQELQKSYPHLIKDIRGRGMILGIEVEESHTQIIKEKAIGKGLLLNVTSGTVVRLIPPLTIGYLEINEFLGEFRNIIKEIQEINHD